MSEQPCKLCNDPMYDERDSYGCHRSKVTGALLPCKSEPSAQPQRVESEYVRGAQMWNESPRNEVCIESVSAPAPTETLEREPKCKYCGAAEWQARHFNESTGTWWHRNLDGDIGVRCCIPDVEAEKEFWRIKF